MRKRNYNKFLSYICPISFILGVLLISIHFWCYNESFYQKEHRSLKLYGKPIAEYIGISDTQLDELTHFTLTYLNDKNASLDKVMNINGKDREVFTDEEKIHMEDVRTLNLNSKIVMYVSIGIFIISVIKLLINKCPFNIFYKANMNVLKIFVLFIVMLGTWIVIDFNSFWNFFHHIFFAGNDLWILDLTKDILIMIVPPEFFFHLVSTITITFVLFVVLYYVVLYVLNRRING